MENTEQTTAQTPKPKAEPTKFDGVSAQINLGTGSETHRRFARHMKELDCTAREFICKLMDVYEDPHVDTDNSEVIANLEQQLADAKNENAAYDATCQNQELEIENLKMELATARNEANENAAKAMKIQTDTDGAIIVKPNPVSAYFLKEMAERENTTPEKILERLFIDDLQNPRANNLPYTVESSRIREVMEKLKQQQ